MSNTMNRAKRMRRHLLLSTTLMAFAPFAGVALAQEAPAADDNEIVVTGARRAFAIQDVPINIAAVGEKQIEDQNLKTLTELSSFVPGLKIIDQGLHASNPIIVRGLNADPLSSNDGDTSGGGTVGIYIGDIPLIYDFRLTDMERVEVLMGPQGTLYGSGTLGGAIRYLPKAPQFGKEYLSVTGDVYGYSEGGDLSNEIGMTFNIPIADNFAIRGTIERLEDQGFIDYPYVVQQPGVSESDIDFGNPAQRAANLNPIKDANDADIVSGRIAARYQPTPWWDATLSYFFQSSFSGGRNISSRNTTPGVQTEVYASAKRTNETFKRSADILALEQKFDLGFAELTSSTGYTRLFENTRRDQSDLLLLLNPQYAYYYYDNFPTFTAFTTDLTDQKKFSQEVRLASKKGDRLSWVVGAFYSQEKSVDSSTEITPGFSQFLFDNYFYTPGFFPRADDIEYYNFGNQDLIEQGLFGEVGFDITKDWNITVGGRYYTYNLRTNGATTFPILRTQTGTYADNVIILPPLTPANQRDEGPLWKFNTSYDFTDDVMGYYTFSEGYRIGNTNGLAVCTPGGGQSVCASPGEEEYRADTTESHEVGFRTQWFDKKLTLNLAAYFIDWKGPQVSSATLVGSQPISINGAGANTRGFETNFDFKATDRFSVRGTYANTDSQLSAFSRELITVTNSANNFLVPNDGSVLDPTSPFFGLTPGDPKANFRIPGEKGDRLPGTAQHAGSLYFSYELPMESGASWNFVYGISAQSKVLTRTGGRGGGYTLPSYVINNASVTYETPKWNVMLYGKNLFDEVAEVGAAGTPLSNQVFTDDAGGPVYTRSFYTFVLPPRVIGLRFSYNFGG